MPPSRPSDELMEGDYCLSHQEQQERQEEKKLTISSTMMQVPCRDADGPIEEKHERMHERSRPGAEVLEDKEYSSLSGDYHYDQKHDGATNEEQQEEHNTKKQGEEPDGNNDDGGIELWGALNTAEDEDVGLSDDSDNDATHDDAGAALISCSSLVGPGGVGSTGNAAAAAAGVRVAGVAFVRGGLTGGLVGTEHFPTKLHKMLEQVGTEGLQSIVSWLSEKSSSSSSGGRGAGGTSTSHYHEEGGDTSTKRGEAKAAHSTVASSYGRNQSHQPPSKKKEEPSLDLLLGPAHDFTPFKVHDPERFVDQIMPRFFQMTKYKSFLRQLNIWGFSRDRSKGIYNGSYYHRAFVRQDSALCNNMKRIKNKGLYKRGTRSSSPSKSDATVRPTAITSSEKKKRASSWPMGLPPFCKRRKVDEQHHEDDVNGTMVEEQNHRRLRHAKHNANTTPSTTTANTSGISTGSSAGNRFRPVLRGLDEAGQEDSTNFTTLGRITAYPPAARHPGGSSTSTVNSTSARGGGEYYGGGGNISKVLLASTTSSREGSTKSGSTSTSSTSSGGTSIGGSTPTTSTAGVVSSPRAPPALSDDPLVLSLLQQQRLLGMGMQKQLVLRLSTTTTTQQQEGEYHGPTSTSTTPGAPRHYYHQQQQHVHRNLQQGGPLSSFPPPRPSFPSQYEEQQEEEETLVESLSPKDLKYIMVGYQLGRVASTSSNQHQQCEDGGGDRRGGGGQQQQQHDDDD